ncbi:uncharacterized protein LOC130892878 isoform X1 [Diorhabda carinulata]|uniref:uncharacterized protein LOC130892878 isoform X1 n=1 Tax=Diorhabda carinulata TaxID=1163345 RepID=UPI0025A2880C|nr:uncharacterized protein LOC130892878 isoform X1 [Diorhabda carinulata]
MDVFMPIALCVIFIIFFTICGWCCKRKREGTVYGYGPSVTVTTTTQHVPSPQVVPPYPIDARHPTPSNNLSGPGFFNAQPPYPTQTPNMPFPQTVPHQYGLPPPSMGIEGVRQFLHGIPNPTPIPSAYPPTTYYQDYHSNPPPYEVAVSQAPAPAPIAREGYIKQAPYNPNYN